MKTLLILGAGTGGTMIANRMARTLDLAEWRILVVDKDDDHIYQPGLLFIPFGIYAPADVVKPKQHFLPHGAELILSDITHVDTANRTVRLGQALRTIHYDQLVIATGTDIHPEVIPGLLDGGGWGENIFDFYTLEGASKLSGALSTFEGGRIVVNVAAMPIKGPAAPLEFLLLADAFFRRRGIRNKVELVYASPLPGTFTNQRCNKALAYMLAAKGIQIESNFSIGSVDNSAQKIVDLEGQEINYDLLVSVPPLMGERFVREAGLGDALNLIRADKFTLQVKGHENVWAIGDAGGIPVAKTSTAAHYQRKTLVANLERAIRGIPPEPSFDGRANFFVESGDGKAMLIDFNYADTQLPGVGPFSLLKESRINHVGKLAFRWMYWNIILKGRDLPVSATLNVSDRSAPAN
jgi:sulfide:quinone oxidoreductase